MTPRKYIVYDRVGSRKVVVIDGMPYYCSTGQSSTHPQVWFPFMLVRGTLPVDLENFPSYLSKSEYSDCVYTYSTYIVKFETGYFKTTPMLFSGVDPKADQLAIRLPTKETIIRSVQLSGDHFPLAKLELVSLTAEEKKRITTESIALANNAIFITDDPDKVNEWLIGEGATIASSLLPQIKQRILVQQVEDQQRIEKIAEYLPEHLSLIDKIQDSIGYSFELLFNDINKLKLLPSSSDLPTTKNTTLFKCILENPKYTDEQKKYLLNALNQRGYDIFSKILLIEILKYSACDNSEHFDTFVTVGYLNAAGECKLTNSDIAIVWDAFIRSNATDLLYDMYKKNYYRQQGEYFNFSVYWINDCTSVDAVKKVAQRLSVSKNLYTSMLNSIVSTRIQTIQETKYIALHKQLQCDVVSQSYDNLHETLHQIKQTEQDVLNLIKKFNEHYRHLLSSSCIARQILERSTLLPIEKIDLLSQIIDIGYSCDNLYLDDAYHFMQDPAFDQFIMKHFSETVINKLSLKNQEDIGIRFARNNNIVAAVKLFHQFHHTNSNRVVEFPHRFMKNCPDISSIIAFCKIITDDLGSCELTSDINKMARQHILYRVMKKKAKPHEQKSIVNFLGQSHGIGFFQSPSANIYSLIKVGDNKAEVEYRNENREFESDIERKYQASIKLP